MVGLLYSIVSEVKPIGFVTTSIVFVGHGILYSMITQPFYKYVRITARSTSEYIYPLVGAVIVFLMFVSTWHVLSKIGGWPLLYAIFQWKANNAVSPLQAIIVFSIGLPISIMIWGYAAIILRRTGEKPKDSIE